MKDQVYRYAAFSHNGEGGNPAGVMLVDKMPPSAKMREIAKQVGDSETVFAMREDDNHFVLKYFAPEAEVDFCGHATIALGKAIQAKYGRGHYFLTTNKGVLELDLSHPEELYFSSPNTSSRPLEQTELDFLLNNSSVEASDICASFPPSMVNAGNDHGLLVVSHYAALASFSYDVNVFKAWMQANTIVTFAVAFMADAENIRIRNGFAFGGVYEDPATGAAAAAVSGYLRDNHLIETNDLTFHQGVEMQQYCVLKTSFTNVVHSPVRLGGFAYLIESLWL